MSDANIAKRSDMNSKQSKANPAVVLYDGACPLCQRSVAILKRLDWRRKLAYQDARDVAHLPETAVPLDPNRLLQEMHLVTPNRKKVYAGYRAFRWMAGRIPLLWPIWPLLFLPGIPWIGQRVYRWVAKNRYNLVSCHDGECAVPLRQPPREAASSDSLPRTPTA
jgi:predicted DCC family thiol-disulfide oxidoreductase YuxK